MPKDATVLRGSKLIKKAIDSAKGSGLITEPEAVPSSLVRKLKLPNGESLPPGMKELLSFDAAWIGVEYDEDEAEIEGMSLDEVIEEHFGEEAVSAFAEASELLSEDCVFFRGEHARPSCLYVGEADPAGEYPVLSFSWEGGAARIGGFVPFDVWAAQELGALERGKTIGGVPAAYEPLVQALADSNGDGRVVFTPTGGDSEAEDEDEDDEDEERETED